VWNKNKSVVLDPLNTIKTIYGNIVYLTIELHDFEGESSYC
jgi:hypothetical protein